MSKKQAIGIVVVLSLAWAAGVHFSGLGQLRWDVKKAVLSNLKS